MQEYESSEVDEIDLGDLFLQLLASWKFIVVFSILGTVISLLVTLFLITPMYKATSTIYVLSRKDSAVNISDLQIGSALTQDYIKVFDIWEIHEEVISNLDLPYSYAKLRSMLTITNDSDTRMLDISVTSPDPEEAARIANEYASVSSAFIADTMSTEKPNIVSAALVPTNPVSPKKTTNVIIGFMAGFALAVAFLTIRILSDDKIKSADDLRKFCDLPTLAIVPIESDKSVKNDKQNRESMKKRAREEKMRAKAARKGSTNE